MKLYPVNPERWQHREDFTVTYDLQFKGQTVKPGMKFKMKNDRNIYTFTCLVTNKEGKTWIECMSPEGFHSIRPDKMFKLVGIKRSYKKKCQLKSN